MGKRKRRQRAELPLFDLPLNPGSSGAESAADLELSKSGDLASDFELSSQEPVPLADDESSETLESDEDQSVSGDRPAPDLSSLFARRDGSAGSQIELLEPMAKSSESPGEAGEEAGQETEHPVDDDSSAVRESDAGADVTAHLGDRILGGLADLAVQVLVLGLAIAAAHRMGVVVTLADWQPFAMLISAFSFLYWTVPLAFWGQTPGMAWVGHTARTEERQPLTFGQTFLRWLGALLTLAFVGLPILAAWTGRSFSDLISKSCTLSSSGRPPDPDGEKPR